LQDRSSWDFRVNEPTLAHVQNSQVRLGDNVRQESSSPRLSLTA
jgi:hypothetical protein